MKPVKSFLRAAAALTVASLMLGFLGAPVCFSSACPMSGAERAACKAMGRECCGTTGGQISHAPAAPVLVLAAVPAALTLAAPAVEPASFADLSGTIAAAPAILQNVGLFTLFDVFLI
ncbi:MAG TPA: hypothetical protein VLV54_08715 [Thermoanaerobaculia bacterium]|nr:hypothetical protein [Thermoanaerobaculia bacterium]